MKAFNTPTSFRTLDTPDRSGAVFHQTAGPILAAKWTDVTHLWLQCEVKFCWNVDYFSDSYCDDVGYPKHTHLTHTVKYCTLFGSSFGLKLNVSAGFTANNYPTPDP